MHNKKLLQLVKKIKKLLKNKTLKIFLISFLTMIGTILVLFFVIWNYRVKIVSFILTNYSPKTEESKTKPILIEKIEEVLIPSEVKTKEEKVLVKEEETVVSAVKKAKPAVVSIVVSKEVPKYDVIDEDDKSTESSDSDAKTPVYVPNGTQIKQVGGGSGFIISSDGIIITNRHVVEGENLKYTVMLNNGEDYVAKVLAQDKVLDVALIKIEAKNLPYLKLADSDLLQVGESVIAIGNALGELKNTVSVGVISGLSRSLHASGDSGFKEFLYNVIQTDAAINPGNSGGPLLNISGEVVGINVAAADDSSSIGFSLPVNSVKDVIEQVKKTGKISRPYLGVRYIVVNQTVKDKLNLSVNYGILVQKGSTDKDPAVVLGSPADKAGILENDIILSMDGIIVDAGNDFMSLIRSKKIGESVVLKVLSGGVEKILTVILGEMPDNF